MYSSISGGDYNAATGNYSSISGGERNEVLGLYSSLLGGVNRILSDDYTTFPAGP